MHDHRRRVYDDILGLSSSEENPTPLVRLNRVVPYKHTTVYAKLDMPSLCEVALPWPEVTQ